MISVIIDGKTIRNIHEAFDFIAQTLSFPEPFGHNYDALYDCLTTTFSPASFSIENEAELIENLGQDAFMLKIVLKDAAEENPFLNVDALI